MFGGTGALAERADESNDEGAPHGQQQTSWGDPKNPQNVLTRPPTTERAGEARARRRANTKPTGRAQARPQKRKKESRMNGRELKKINMGKGVAIYLKWNGIKKFNMCKGVAFKEDWY